MVMMDTLEIDRVLAKVPGFLGAHAFNELPAKPSGDYSIVVNTNAKEGEHWLAIVRKNGKNYFLDSFGRSLESELFSEEFRKTLRSYVGGRMIYSSKWLQSLDSNTCGEYCVYFISKIQRNSLISILRRFGEDLKSNDNYVYSYYLTL